MPVALDIDRAAIKTLVLKGLKPAQIERETGVKRVTIKQWIQRYGWTADREALSTPQGEPLQVPDTKNVATRVSTTAFNLAEKILCRLNASTYDSIRDCKDAALALSSAYLTARKALGMDDVGSTHLHLHVMSGAKLVSVQDTQVLEVQATPVPLPDAQPGGPAQPDQPIPPAQA